MLTSKSTIPPILIVDHVCRGKGACSAIVNVANKPQNLTFTCKKIIPIFCVLPEITVRIGVLGKLYFSRDKPPNQVLLEFIIVIPRSRHKPRTYRETVRFGLWEMGRTHSFHLSVNTL